MCVVAWSSLLQYEYFGYSPLVVVRLFVSQKVKCLGSADASQSLLKTAAADTWKAAIKKEDPIAALAAAGAGGALRVSPSAGQLTPVRSSARLRQKCSSYSSAFATNSSSNSSGSNTPAAASATTAAAAGGDAAAAVNQMQLDAEAEEVYSKIAVKIECDETESDVDIMADDDDVTNAATALTPVRATSSNDVAISNNSGGKTMVEPMDVGDVKFHIKVDSDLGKVTPRTVATTDVTKPLEIKTSYMNLPPGPGTGSSTDTASEVGSALSSPVCSTGQPSPNVLRSIAQHELQHPVTSSSGNATTNNKLEVSQMSKLSLVNRDVSPARDAAASRSEAMTSGSETGSPEQRKMKRKKPPRPRGFWTVPFR